MYNLVIDLSIFNNINLKAVPIGDHPCACPMDEIWDERGTRDDNGAPSIRATLFV
jgi:hypothetical protein